VSHDSISDAIESLTNTVTKFYYLHTLTTDAIAVRCVREDGTDYSSCYGYAVAMPEEPIVTMFTHETFPRGLVYVREKDSPVLIEAENIVLGIRQHTVATSSGSHTYARLAESLEMSLDNGKTWQPCGEFK